MVVSILAGFIEVLKSRYSASPLLALTAALCSEKPDVNKNSRGRSPASCRC